jgi:predicted SprT family Zn-dependent metalloprotease
VCVDRIKSKSDGKTTHVTTIDLATKVTDTEEKLRHTLAHELCHVAAWVLSGEMKPPHGE